MEPNETHLTGGHRCRTSPAFGYFPSYHLGKRPIYPRMGEKGNAYISENTVRTHARHIYTKLGVGSREEIIDLIDEG